MPLGIRNAEKLGERIRESENGVPSGIRNSENPASMPLSRQAAGFGNPK